MKRWLILFLLGSYAPLWAQGWELHGALGVHSQQQTLAVGLHRPVGRWMSEKLNLSIGLRATLSTSQDQNFTSAPPQLAGKPEREDTLMLGRHNAVSTNLYLQADYRWGAWAIGFNIDLAGLTVGNRSSDRFQSSQTGVLSLESQPTPWNVLLVDKNDIGQLINSEFFLARRVGPQWALKAGLSHFFSERQTSWAPTEANRRFRHIANVLMLGVIWSPAKNRPQ